MLEISSLFYQKTHIFNGAALKLEQEMMHLEI